MPDLLPVLSGLRRLSVSFVVGAIGFQTTHIQLAHRRWLSLIQIEKEGLASFAGALIPALGSDEFFELF